MNSIARKVRRLVSVARSGVSRFEHRGVVVWQFGAVCDQVALSQAIDAALDDAKTPRERRDEARGIAESCTVHLRPSSADDAPMVATWRRGALGDSGLVVVGVTDGAGEMVRRGLLALIRRRMGLPVLVESGNAAVA